MSKLSKEDILKLARLARLQLHGDEVAKYQKELTAILDYVKVLDSVDTTGIEPTYQVTGLTNVTREDVIVDYGITPKELLKNVPHIQGDYIRVKRMIG